MNQYVQFFQRNVTMVCGEGKALWLEITWLDGRGNVLWSKFNFQSFQNGYWCKTRSCTLVLYQLYIFVYNKKESRALAISQGFVFLHVNLIMTAVRNDGGIFSDYGQVACQCRVMQNKQLHGSMHFPQKKSLNFFHSWEKFSVFTYPTQNLTCNIQ